MQRFRARDCVGGRADGSEGGVWRSAPRAGNAECVAVSGRTALPGDYCAGPKTGGNDGAGEFGGAIGIARVERAEAGDVGGASGGCGGPGGKSEESGD